MNMKNYFTYFIIGIFLLVSKITFSEGFVGIVKVNENECLKCYAAQEAFLAIEGLSLRKVVFKSFKNKTVDRFMKINFPIVSEKVEVVISDSAYNEYDSNNLGSEFLLLKGDQIVFQCLMKEVWNNLNRINSITANDDKVIKLDSEIEVLSASIKCDDDGCVLFDVVQQSFFQFNYKGDLIKQINSEDFSVADILSKAPQVTDSNYFKARPLLNKLGQDLIRFAGFSTSAGVLYIAAQIPHPEFVNANSGQTRMVLNKESVFIKMELGESYDQFSIISINERTIPENYYIDQQSFVILGSLLYLPVYKNNTDVDRNKCMALFRIRTDENHNGIASFEKFLNWELPSVFTELHPESPYKNLQPKISESYCYFGYSNEIYTIEDSLVFATPFVNKKIEFDYANMRIDYDFLVHDIFYDSKKQTISLLYQDAKNNYYHASKSLQDDRYNIRKIKVDGSELVSFIHLKDGSGIYYFNSRNSLIISSIAEISYE